MSSIIRQSYAVYSMRKDTGTRSRGVVGQTVSGKRNNNDNNNNSFTEISHFSTRNFVFRMQDQ